jgi:hypothetical protein
VTGDVRTLTLATPIVEVPTAARGNDGSPIRQGPASLRPNRANPHAPTARVHMRATMASAHSRDDDIRHLLLFASSSLGITNSFLALRGWH